MCKVIFPCMNAPPSIIMYMIGKLKLFINTATLLQDHRQELGHSPVAGPERSLSTVYANLW